MQTPTRSPAWTLLGSLWILAMAVACFAVYAGLGLSAFL